MGRDRTGLRGRGRAVRRDRPRTEVPLPSAASQGQLTAVTNKTGPGGVSGSDLAAWNRARPLEAALAYAQRGWPVFPIAPGDHRTGLCACQDGADCEQIAKHPLVRWGDRASTDDDQIRDWWRWKPLANIGVATGQRSGLLVVDLDRHHDGLRTREKLAERGLIFPSTVAARTRSGGWHFFYSTPPGGRVLNTEGGLAGVGKTPGIDVRGDGGYIIVAPSIRPAPGPVGEGPQLGRYQWVDRPSRLADAPEWVTVPEPATEPAHAGVPSARPRLPSAGRNLSARAQAALDGEIRRVQQAGDGHRNAAFVPCCRQPVRDRQHRLSQRGTGPRRVDRRFAKRRPGRTGDPPNPRCPMATQVRRPARRLGSTATAPRYHHPEQLTSHPALSGTSGGLRLRQ